MAARRRIVPPPPPPTGGARRSQITPVPAEPVETAQSCTRLKAVVSDPPSVPPEAIRTNPPPAATCSVSTLSGPARAEVDEGAKTTELRVPTEVLDQSDSA